MTAAGGLRERTDIDKANLVEILQAYETARRRSAGSTAVLWVFRDASDDWCVRKEGGDIEVTFRGRDLAVTFARAVASAWGSYHLFIELKNGRVAQEFFSPSGTPQ